MKPEIVQATGENLDTLCYLGRHTFLEAFAKDNTEEDIIQYVDEAFANDRVKEELNNPESEYYLATIGGQSIGYLKINYGQAQTEKHNLSAVEIERIYVSEAYYGMKVGQSLFAKALEIAHQRKANSLWLGVWEKNLKAIKFYKKHGFIAFDRHSFLLGKDLQTDILMQLDLSLSHASR